MRKLGIRLGTGIDEDLVLYRYQTLSQFISLIETRTSYLSRITTWDDHWEAPFGQLPTVNNDGTLKQSRHSISQDFFGQCWTMNGESDALWRIYSPNKEGIMLQTSAKKFLSIKRILHGLLGIVTYTDFKEIKHFPQGIFEEALYKRKAYEHENEVRVITVLQEPQYKEINHYNIEVDVNDFIEGITIDPRASQWFVEMIYKYCVRAGLKVIPIQSDLYTSDVFETIKVARKWVPYTEE